VSNASGMRDHLILRINGVRREVRGSDALLTLSSYLRDRLGLVGTKVMCAEGDCGACTVLAADEAWTAERDRLRQESFVIDGEVAGRRILVSSPATLAEALMLRLDPEARVIAGGTDLGVLWNKGRLRPRHWIDISRLDALAGLTVESAAAGPTLVAGPLATWTDMIAICRVHCPEAVPVLRAFGGPQIRHVGTLGGNIVNGSPIADALPLLFVLEATLCLASAEATREVPIGSFFRGYKSLDLAADELLVRIRIPLPAADQVLRLVKVARRRDLDISGFTAAILMRRRGERISDARIAYGGVGPTVLRLGATEAFLAGRPFTEETFRLAGERAAAEIRPQTDVRGTAGYRRQLARGVLLRFFHQQRAEA